MHKVAGGVHKLASFNRFSTPAIILLPLQLRCGTAPTPNTNCRTVLRHCAVGGAVRAVSCIRMGQHECHYRLQGLLGLVFRSAAEGIMCVQQLGLLQRGAYGG